MRTSTDTLLIHFASSNTNKVIPFEGLTVFKLIEEVSESPFARLVVHPKTPAERLGILFRFVDKIESARSDTKVNITSWSIAIGESLHQANTFWSVDAPAVN